MIDLNCGASTTGRRRAPADRMSRACRGLALVLVLAACGRVEEVPLGDLLDGAVIETRTRRIDFGDPSARRRLIEGWSWDETGFVPPTSFAWSVGPSSSLEIYSPDGADTVATLRIAPFPFEDGPLTLTVAFNGAPIASFDLDATLRDYPVELRDVAVGGNVLTCSYSQQSDQAGEFPRSIAVAWDEVRIGRNEEAIGEVRSGEQLDELVIPFGTSVALFERLPPDSRLAIDRIRASDPHARLMIRSIADEGRVIAEHELRPRARRRDVELSPVSGAVGLTLTALTDDPDAAGELALLRPTLLVPAAAPSDEPATPLPATPPPDIFVYLVDTLRADHLGAYGYDRATSPRLDAFAADAVLFERPIAQSPWTRPSVVSIFTGVTPRAHRVNRRADALAPALTTLAEQLRAAGYQTAAIVTNVNVGSVFGLDQGFDTFVEWPHDVRSDIVNDEVSRFLDERGDDPRPLFLYVHTLDPHAPYAPIEPFKSRFAADADPEVGTIKRINAIGARAPQGRELGDLVDLYDAEVAENDENFGLFLDELGRRGLYEGSLIVFTSDHGEEFWDHGNLQHAKTLYDELIRVPLVVRFPGGGAARRVAEPVQHVDIHATVLAQAGLIPPPDSDGLDLRRALVDHPAQRFILSYVELDRRHGVAIGRGMSKLIELTVEGFDHRRQLFDVAADPGERHNLIGAKRPLAWWLRSAHAADLQRPTSIDAPLEVEAGEELVRQLRALGYVH